jgi:hypothetical protein
MKNKCFITKFRFEDAHKWNFDKRKLKFEHKKRLDLQLFNIFFCYRCNWVQMG